jgi:hypothetical protein
LKLTPKDIVIQLAVAASLISEVVQHAVRGDIVRVHLSHVHQSLLDCEELTLIELNHIGELSLFLRKLGILLLLFSELTGGLK